MNPLAFFAWLAGTVAALACGAVLLGVAVDPYRMYGTTPVAGWTALKPRIYNEAYIAKIYQLERVGSNTVLLGNSRVEIGIDPEDPHWPAAAQPVFNAAVAGGNLRTALVMLRAAIAVRRPHTVFLGLDFLDFLQRPDVAEPAPEPMTANERRLPLDRNGLPNHGRALQMWRDRVTTTLTLDAILDSAATLLDQDPETTSTMTPLGFNPLHEYRVFAARQGYNELFAQKNAVYREQYRRYPAPDFREPAKYSSFRYLAAIIALASERGCRLTLFIHPYHADYLEMLRQVGLWDSFANWKRALVKMLAAEPGSPALFDFSGYNRYTTERVPSPDDRRTIMRWYWEAGHYKAALGDRMLETMLGGSTAFGSLLTATTVETVLREIERARDEVFLTLGASQGASPGLVPRLR